jgi:anti-anti-sigma factor
VSHLEASVTAGESGPVIVLSGEADLTSLAHLEEVITAQLSTGAPELTVDLSGLTFIDSVSARTLLLAAKALRQRGGHMVLLGPQRPVARTLAILGVEHMFVIRDQA